MSFRPSERHNSPSSSSSDAGDASDDADDIEREAIADGDRPFPVKRPILRTVIHEITGASVVSIQFLSSGTFHKAFLIVLDDGRELVFRIARRFMPRFKTESEVATLNYIRAHTTIPVPTVYHFDSNPLNRLGGEYILMSKAPGIPLARLYYHLPADTLRRLLKNVAELLVPLFAHRFSKTGSLYQSRPHSSKPKPTTRNVYSSEPDFFVGPIVSWAFFGGGRGEDSTIDRGPWSSTDAYLRSCTEREIEGVHRESQGQTARARHTPHMAPEDYEYDSSQDSDPEDKSWQSQRWARGAAGLYDSDSDPGEVAYRDYRKTQRSSFLVVHALQRVDQVKAEMARFLRIAKGLAAALRPGDGGAEEFSIDVHDLSLDNLFVDENDHSKISCIIDWESTTIRPLWYCAHVPSFLTHSYAHPHLLPTESATAIFKREAALVNCLPPDIPATSGARVAVCVPHVGEHWAAMEKRGEQLRNAHRLVEWDGWEEGLADAVLGEEPAEPQDYFGSTAWRGLVRAESSAGVGAGSVFALAAAVGGSPRSGIGVNGYGATALNGKRAARESALVKGVEEGLRKNGLIRD